MKNFIKKFILQLLLFCIVISNSIPVSASNNQKFPTIDAKAAIVMDAATGQILYDKNMKKQKYPASLTKLMTVLLTLENCKFNEKVKFSEEAVFGIEPGSSNIGIVPGEILTVEQCLYGMMLESANEVCSAIAEHISGSVEDFAKLMTKHAKELGCINTQFQNANGLHDDDHYTTAYDMALVLQELLKHPEFRTIASSRNYELKKTNKSKARWLGNHHKMIRYPQSDTYSISDSVTVTSGKTAFTLKAKTCLATSATNGEMELICIVMDDTGASVYWDTQKLLRYIFKNYEYMQPLKSYNTMPIASSNLIAHNLFEFVHPETLNLKVNTNYIVTIPKNADMKKLTISVTKELDSSTNKLGTLHIYYDNKEVGQTPVFFSPITISKLEVHSPYKSFDLAHFHPKNFHFYMLSTAEKIFLFSVIFILFLLLLFGVLFYINLMKKRRAIRFSHNYKTKSKKQI